MNWKKTLFGNPFKKSKSQDDYGDIEGLINIYGQPGADKIAQKEQEKLANKVFDTREEASEAISDQLRKAYYKELFFTIRVRCPNCLIQGIVRLSKGTVADEAECPRFEVEGLQVLGIGSDIETDILNNPRLDDESENLISGQVQDAVEHAWSIGRIKRQGGIFDG